jgi:hypothetical protein
MAQFDVHRRRLVVLLVRLSELPVKSKIIGSRLNPQLANDIAIAEAIDEVFTRSWG